MIVLPLFFRLVRLFAALLLQSFQPGIAICRVNGGGGNRTRVTSHPDASGMQDFSVRGPADEPRPRLCNSTSNAASSTREALSAHIGESYSPHRDHSGVLRLLGVARPRRSFRNWFTALVRACVDDRHLALGVGVAGVGRDRDAGVSLGSLRPLPVAARVRLHGLEQLRHPAGESVPAGVAGTSRQDVACAGETPHQLRAQTLRRAVGGARVPTRARLVLTGGAA